ncbi:DUF5677 domain-containing protein [Bacillus cereus]|nr:DUF5677 domain-containing protein [Bacillus cereus]MDA2079508.1 DUF5677 domain-containing protein [Bacillus cereus]MDA2085080.1 DUF5677 domain-containing protein [Bacillus cereus]
MGRKSNKKKERREGKHIPISGHQRQGAMLMTPFSKIQNMKLVSWKDDRLPSFLWIGLIINLNDRATGINIIKWICKYFQDKSNELRPEELKIEAITKMPDDQIEEFYQYIFNELSLIEELKPLLLFDSFPKKHLLEKFISLEELDQVVEFEKLYSSVANMMDHQSQLSTDCRWARLFYLMVTDKAGLGHMVKDMFNYPGQGDGVNIEGVIRATENAMDMFGELEPMGWAQQFWDEALNISPCWDLNATTEGETFKKLTLKNIEKVEIEIKEHFYKSRTTSAIDAKYEASFAFALYCVDILKELAYTNIQNGITGRLGLRTIAECYITLAYLVKKNSDDLWLSYRSYGSGQAKLAFLKIFELEDQPQFISLETLGALANEDQWQEYSNINLGHWEKSNLRTMSEFAKVKDIYNKYYDWTSGFSHGQWSSLRSVEFTICGNPLHRLHRIPAENKKLPTVILDAVELCNKIIEILYGLYPKEKFELIETE